jgi:hypothetical protein
VPQVFKEPSIHARNHNFDFVAVYGSLAPGEPFGFRYSGHHFDLSFQIDADGNIDVRPSRGSHHRTPPPHPTTGLHHRTPPPDTLRRPPPSAFHRRPQPSSRCSERCAPSCGSRTQDLPTFLGHNPLVVPAHTPPASTGHEDYLQWRNMAGVPQFPDAVDVVLEATSLLTESSYVPLNQWLSTPANGGLTLKDGKTLADVPHIDMATMDADAFETLWALIDYTLEFARGARPRPEKAAFRAGGKMVWSTSVHPHETHVGHHIPKTVAQLTSSRSFFYVRAETDDLLFFVMVNSLFTLMLEDEPSNHLHSILIPKSYLA